MKEMYLKVKIQEKDGPSFGILWNDLYSSFQHDAYEFSLVVFAKISAPMKN